MTAPVLIEMPPSFASGETVTYERLFSDYSPADGWSLTAYLAGASVESATATVSGNKFIVTFAATDTAPLTAGNYQWEERVSKTTTVIVVARGRVEVLPNIAAAVTGDMQAWAEATLAAVEARLKGNASTDVLRYQIAGRSLEHYSLDELMRFRNQLRSEIRSVRAGGRFSTPVLIKFTGTRFDA